MLTSLGFLPFIIIIILIILMIMTKKNTSKTKSMSRICMTKKNHNMPKDTNSHGAIEGDNERSRHKSKHDNNR